MPPPPPPSSPPFLASDVGRRKPLRSTKIYNRRIVNQLIEARRSRTSSSVDDFPIQQYFKMVNDMHTQTRLPNPPASARPARSKPRIGGVVFQFISTMLMINGYKGLGHIDIPDYLVPKVRDNSPRNRARCVLLTGVHLDLAYQGIGGS